MMPQSRSQTELRHCAGRIHRTFQCCLATCRYGAPFYMGRRQCVSRLCASPSAHTYSCTHAASVSCIIASTLLLCQSESTSRRAASRPVVVRSRRCRAHVVGLGASGPISVCTIKAKDAKLRCSLKYAMHITAVAIHNISAYDTGHDIHDVQTTMLNGL